MACSSTSLPCSPVLLTLLGAAAAAAVVSAVTTVVGTASSRTVVATACVMRLLPRLTRLRPRLRDNLQARHAWLKLCLTAWPRVDRAISEVHGAATALLSCNAGQREAHSEW